MEELFDVALADCPDYAEETVRKALEEAIEKIGGMPFAKPGKKIVIKTNAVALKSVDSAATTHPMMVNVLCKMLIEKGCEVVVGDSPGGIYTPAYLAAVYRGIGLNIIEKTGAKLNYNTATKKAKLDGKVVKELEYTAYLDDADYIIDFAKLKTHGMLALTASVKNMFGMIPGTMKPEYHYKYPKPEDFSNMLIDLNLFIKPVLYLIDACDCMEGNGPTGGSPRHIGALIASYDGFSADLLASKLIDLEPKKVPYLVEAMKRGLCRESTDELNVYGDVDKYIVKDFKKMPEVHIGFNSNIVEKVFSRKPVLDADKCRECGKCAELCPKKAIKLSPKPVINRKLCIKCFCCQEFCPFSALEAKRPFIARILNGKQ